MSYAPSSSSPFMGTQSHMLLSLGTSAFFSGMHYLGYTPYGIPEGADVKPFWLSQVSS